jgi:hypothetical protein
MKKYLTLVLLTLVSATSIAAVHPGFVNLKQCVYFKDNASHRSDCSNSNTTCASDGRCTVTINSQAYDGDVDDLIVLRKEEKHWELKPYEFSEDDILDLRKTRLKRNQIILEE